MAQSCWERDKQRWNETELSWKFGDFVVLKFFKILEPQYNFKSEDSVSFWLEFRTIKIPTFIAFWKEVIFLNKLLNSTHTLLQYPLLYSRAYPSLPYIFSGPSCPCCTPPLCNSNSLRVCTPSLCCDTKHWTDLASMECQTRSCMQLSTKISTYPVLCIRRHSFASPPNF